MPTTDPADLLTISDVLDLPWGEIVEGAPPPDVEAFYLESVLEARRFVVANGAALLPRCRVYSFVEGCQRRILAVEALGSVSEIEAHIENMLAEILAANEPMDGTRAV